MLGLFIVFIGLSLLAVFIVAAAKNSSSRSRRGKSRYYSGSSGSYSGLYSGDAGAI